MYLVVRVLKRKYNKKLSWYKDKNIVITGASSGIGYAFASHLCSVPCNLIICGRDKEALYKSADSLINRGGTVKGLFISDLADIGQTSKLIEEIKALCIPDVLINNAGYGEIRDFASISEADMLAMISVNCTSPLMLIRSFVNEMKGLRGCGILNVGSVASFFPTPGSALYCATKHFILGLTDALHHELKPHGVYVTGLYPGHTMTQFIQRASKGRLAQWQSAMSAEDVALAGLIGLSKNALRVVPGLTNKTKVAASKIVPPEIIMQRVYRKAKKVV